MLSWLDYPGDASRGGNEGENRGGGRDGKRDGGGGNSGERRSGRCSVILKGRGEEERKPVEEMGSRRIGFLAILEKKQQERHGQLSAFSPRSKPAGTGFSLFLVCSVGKRWVWYEGLLRRETG